MDQKLKTSITEFEEAHQRASEDPKDSVLADAVAKHFYETFSRRVKRLDKIP